MHMPRPSAFPWLLPLLASLLLATACHSAPAANAKPDAPLTLTIEPRGEVVRGGIGQFTVVATVFVDSADFAMDVDLPDDLALYSGDLHHQGAVRAHTRFETTFGVRVPESGTHEIRATARMAMGSGHFRADANYVIGDRPASSAGAPGVTRERNGETVREYRLP